jgi:exosortase
MDKQPDDGVLEEFRIEFIDYWRQLPNKGFFLVLLAVWLALFHFLGSATLGYVRTPSLFGWMYNAYTGGGAGLAHSDEAYGLLIPVVVLALFWSKRRELMALELRLWWPGLLLLAVGVMTHILGYAVQQSRISVVGLFTGIYGLMGLAWGPAWLRVSFFPFFLFGFCIPLGSMAESITVPLRLLVSQLVEGVSHYILFIDVRREGNRLFNPAGGYQYEVAAACSGIRSLIAIAAFAIIMAFISFHTWWKRLLVAASAVPLAVLGNLIRMLMIIIAAEIGGPSWGEYVHNSTIISMLPYVPAFVVLLLADRYFYEPKKTVSPKPPG